MSFFSLRTASGTAWPAFVRPEASQVWSMYQELDRTQWLSPAEIEAGQLAQARALLYHAADHVPYYRRLLAKAGVVPHRVESLADFRRIPCLTRRTYQDNFPAICATHLPEGTIATSKTTTSGSTGEPVEILQTNVVNNVWWGLYLRDAEWCGFNHRGSLAIIRTTRRRGAELERAMQGVVYPIWNNDLTALMETGPCHLMDIHQDCRVQLAWLRRIQPDYMLVFPSNVDVMARLAAEEGMGIGNLKVIQTIAETLTPESQARIEAAFGVPVKNTYSCTEAGYLASPCPEGHGLHVHAENIILEVLDADGSPCQPGQTGRVVVTTLHNLRTPFIRYDIGDEATVGPAQCPCGRGLPLLLRVAGRRRPMFLLPDGRQRYCSPLLFGLEGLEASYQFQIVQKALDRVLVRLVPNKRWHHGMEARIVQMVHEFFEAPVQVEIQCLERLELPPGGKYRIAVNELVVSG